MANTISQTMIQASTITIYLQLGQGSVFSLKKKYIYILYVTNA